MVCLLLSHYETMFEFETTAPVQVAFSHEVESSTIMGSSRQRRRADGGSSSAYSEASTTGEMQDHFTSTSAVRTQGVTDNIVDETGAATVKKEKEYRAPWVKTICSLLSLFQTIWRKILRLSLCL